MFATCETRAERGFFVVLTLLALGGAIGAGWAATYPVPSRADLNVFSGVAVEAGSVRSRLSKDPDRGSAVRFRLEGEDAEFVLHSRHWLEVAESSAQLRGSGRDGANVLAWPSGDGFAVFELHLPGRAVVFPYEHAHADALSEHNAAIAMTVLGGFCAAGLLILGLLGPRPTPPRFLPSARVSAEFHAHRAGHLAGALFVFGFMSLFWFAWQESLLLGLLLSPVGCVFAGLALCLSLEVVCRAPVISVNTRGIALFGEARIPWEAIERVSQELAHLSVLCCDQEDRVARMSRLARIRAGAFRSASSLRVPIGWLEVTDEEVLAAIETHGVEIERANQRSAPLAD